MKKSGSGSSSKQWLREGGDRKHEQHETNPNEQGRFGGKKSKGAGNSRFVCENSGGRDLVVT